MKYYLSIDIGASSGRHILSSVQNGKLILEEVYRFENGMTEKDGHLVWDYKKLFSDILQGMKECKKAGKIPLSVGIDTWGVDYALIDKAGEAMFLHTVTEERQNRLKNCIAKSLLKPYMKERGLSFRFTIRFINFIPINFPVS